MTIEESFRQWWIESYGVPPGTHAVMTHTAWAQHVLQQLPDPPAELVVEWADAASNGGEATLAVADQRLAAAVIQWARGHHAAG
jgi:hypothetical protein